MTLILDDADIKKAAQILIMIYNNGNTANGEVDNNSNESIASSSADSSSSDSSASTTNIWEKFARMKPLKFWRKIYTSNARTSEAALAIPVDAKYNMRDVIGAGWINADEIYYVVNVDTDIPFKCCYRCRKYKHYSLYSKFYMPSSCCRSCIEKKYKPQRK